MKLAVIKRAQPVHEIFPRAFFLFQCGENIGKVAAFLVWPGAVILFIEVFARYVFNSPTVWAHGYTQRIFGSYFILMGAFTLLAGGHVRIDLLSNRFSDKISRWFDLLNLGLLLLWASVLIIESWTFFQNSWKVKEVDQMVLAHPIYPVKFMLFVGSILIAVQGLSLFLQTIIKMMKGTE